MEIARLRVTAALALARPVRLSRTGTAPSCTASKLTSRGFESQMLPVSHPTAQRSAGLPSMKSESDMDFGAVIRFLPEEK
jgi:hypothetical protein